MRRISIPGVLLALCGPWLAAGAQAQSTAPWKPVKNVEVIVSAAAAGSSDRSARVVQKLLSANPAFPSVTVNNRPGGGGTVAWSYLQQHAGDAHYISTFSSTMLTNEILGVGSKLSYRDFTPLTIMLREYPVLVVRAESPIANTKDLMERLKKDPSSVSFSFASSVGNHNHVIIGLLLKAAGADPKKAKVVVQKSGGEATTAMLGGHIDVMVGAPANVIPHLQSGKARGIGISAPQRQGGGLAGVPTLRESGADAVYFSWRGFIGAKDLTPAQIAFWDQAFARAVQGEEWKQDVEANAWAEDFMNSAATRRHLDSEHAMLIRVMGDLGLAGRP
jgi:putative tricarboxylic transport membrane protein